MVSINARIYVLEDLFDIYGRTKYFLLIWDLEEENSSCMLTTSTLSKDINNFVKIWMFFVTRKKEK